MATDSGSVGFDPSRGVHCRGESRGPDRIGRGFMYGRHGTVGCRGHEACHMWPMEWTGRSAAGWVRMTARNCGNGPELSVDGPKLCVDVDCPDSGVSVGRKLFLETGHIYSELWILMSYFCSWIQTGFTPTPCPVVYAAPLGPHPSRPWTRGAVSPESRKISSVTPVEGAFMKLL